MNQAEIRREIEAELKKLAKEGVSGWKIRRLRELAPKLSDFGHEAGGDKVNAKVDASTVAAGVRGLLKTVDTEQARGFRARAEEFLARERKKKRRDCCSTYRAAYVWPFCVAGC